MPSIQRSAGARSDPFLAFNFIVEIEGLLAGGFSECGGLQIESKFFDYREGGVNDYEHHFWGPAEYPPLVLKRGLSQADGLWGWYREVILGKVARKNGTIYLLDKQRNVVRSWNFKQAVPSKWSGPELRADSNVLAFESVELVHRGLS
jgi:phage tail-like protein